MTQCAIASDPVVMSADIIHPGHLNIIREAAKLGEVTGGRFMKVELGGGMSDRLCLVMPVYNEREAIGGVLRKWTSALDTL